MTLFYNIVLAVIGFSSGVVVAGGIFAFIAMIGIVPRMAQRTQTVKYISLYEDAIMIGGVFGTTTMFIDYYFPIGHIGAIIIGLSSGIFVGSLAVSLAEVINVIPIFIRRARLTKGIALFILAIAIGKVVGSLLYFYMKGFYVM